MSNPSSVKTRLNDEDLRPLDLHALNPDLYVNGNSFATFITESAFYDVLLFSSSKKVKEMLPKLPQSIFSIIKIESTGKIKVLSDLSDIEESYKVLYYTEYQRIK